MLRQSHALRLLPCMGAILLLCALAACGSGSPGNSDTPGTPTAVKPAPEPITSYPAVQTGSVPGAVLTIVPTLHPATVQALAVAPATNAAIREATEISVFATYDAVARVEQTITSIVVRQQEATRQVVETQAAQTTKTAFASQAGSDATVVPPGDWGGVGIEVHVLSDTMQVELRCDGGTSLVPLTMDSSGAFNLPSIITLCPASCLSNIPAHYQGQVNGSRLTLSVLWEDEGQSYTNGPFSATLGQTPDMRGSCPKCLSGNTLIDTPNGAVPVKELREGMLVWTESSDRDNSGARQRVTVLKTSRTKVQAGHEMVHLVLADGRELLASPGHPMADGRLLGTLSTGNLIDGVRIMSAQLVPYEEDFTYDILPSGDTNTYWANGILIGSTLTESVTTP